MYTINSKNTSKITQKNVWLIIQQRRRNRIIKNIQSQKKADKEGKENKEEMGKIENKYQDDRLILNHIITLNVNVLNLWIQGQRFLYQIKKEEEKTKLNYILPTGNAFYT